MNEQKTKFIQPAKYYCIHYKNKSHAEESQIFFFKVASITDYVSYIFLYG